MWAVLYDDGMSLTTASERVAHSLAEAERQRGHRVTVRRLDDVETHPCGAEKPAPPPGRARSDGPVGLTGADKPSVPGPSRAVGGADSVPEPIRPAERLARPEPISEPEPASETSPPELTREPEPASAAAPARRRRLLLYALAAASIVVAAALADHWSVLPRVGATISSSPTQVSGPPHRPPLLPPLDQPPVMHFSNAVNATSTPRPQSATGESSGGGPSTIAPGRMTLMRTRATATRGTAVPVRPERARTFR